MATSVTVHVLRRTENPLPSYETPDSAGVDLRANLEQPVDLQPGDRCLIPTGLSLEIPAGYEGQVRPRSGLALKQGLTVLNAPGTVDADYRGEVGVILANLSREAQRIEPGDRIAQLVFTPVTRADLAEVEELRPSERGQGGFGSTGKR